AAALTALERIGDRRTLAAALPLTMDPDVDVALAAIAAAGAFVRDPNGVTAIDRLTALAVDRARPASIRAAAVAALQALGPSTIKPLVDTLAGAAEDRRGDPRARTRCAARGAGGVARGAGRGARAPGAPRQYDRALRRSRNDRAGERPSAAGGLPRGGIGARRRHAAGADRR